MTTENGIELNEIDGRGRYSIETGAGEAELIYHLDSAGRMVISHTYVPPEARGREIALRLLERAVKDAKTRGLKILPQCSYAARVAERREEWTGLFV